MQKCYYNMVEAKLGVGLSKLGVGGGLFITINNSNLPEKIWRRRIRI
jgi:hypothetical protein